jgi:hypothetical protein
MSIPHRIFVSKHKHKKKFIRRKPVYKKFLGLKAFKTRLYEEFALPRVLPTPVKKRAKRRITKKLVRKKCFLRLWFPNLKLLKPRIRRQEVILAQKDIANFKDLKVETVKPEVPQEKFQAFIPQDVWDKMSSPQRKDHIIKRTALAKNRQSGPIPTRKYFFFNKVSRPVVNQMTFIRRREYLKNLIKFANISGPNLGVVPFDTRLRPSVSTDRVKDIPQASVSTDRVRALLHTNKKIRAKGNTYKDLTYTSLVPSRVAKLTLLKYIHAKI